MTRKKDTSRRGGRIVVYLEPDAKRAALLDLVIRLARSRKAEVLVLRVLRELPWYVRGGRAKEIRAALEHDAVTRLDGELASLARAGVKFRSRVVWGRPFQVIIGEAQRRPTQLVLTTAQGRGHEKASPFGSTTMQLFRECPVPVWAVKTRKTRRIRRVLVAVDPAEPTPDEIDLNVELVRAGLEVARTENAELHVCHAFSTLSEHVLPQESRPYVAEFRAQVREALRELLAPFDIPLDDRRVHLLNGAAGQVIPRLVARDRFDLLVMGTIARAGVPGLLIGNTAERMLGEANCSVLAIKPRGFVSLVRPAR